MTVSEKMIEAATRADAEFAGRTFDGLSGHEKTRYRERAKLMLEASIGVGAAKVKPLEWEQIMSPREDGPAEPTGDIEAITMIGEYSVCFDTDEGVTDIPWCCWSPVENIGHFYDFDAAKDAAQADYEARILGALEPTHG